jgi:hypothetical protein
MTASAKVRRSADIVRPRPMTFDDDLSACPACLDGEPHAHRVRRSSWGCLPAPDSGAGGTPTLQERAESSSPTARSLRPDSRPSPRTVTPPGRGRGQSSIAGQSGIYGPATWNEHPTHRPESWPRAILAALVGLLAVAVWCAAIYAVAG